MSNLTAWNYFSVHFVQLVSPAITPSRSIAFKCYAQGPSKAKDDVEFSSQKLVVAGESDTVEFFSTNESEAAAADASEFPGLLGLSLQLTLQSARYYVGIRNKKTNVVTIRPAQSKCSQGT